MVLILTTEAGASAILALEELELLTVTVPVLSVAVSVGDASPVSPAFEPILSPPVSVEEESSV